MVYANASKGVIEEDRGWLPSAPPDIDMEYDNISIEEYIHSYPQTQNN